jgi:hypothetical protein
MRVYIGPYKNWIGPYQIADAIFFWVDRRGIFPDDDPRHDRWDYKAAETFGGWLANIKWLDKSCRWLCDKRKRTIKVRIDEYDTWSMDHTLALIISPMLKQLKATKHGSPFVSDEDVPEHLRSTAAPELTEDEKNWGETDALFHARWIYVLNEMIFAFDLELDDEWEDEYYKNSNYDEMNKVFERQKNGYRLFGKYYNGLWD